MEAWEGITELREYSVQYSRSKMKNFDAEELTVQRLA